MFSSSFSRDSEPAALLSPCGESHFLGAVTGIVFSRGHVPALGRLSPHTSRMQGKERKGKARQAWPERTHPTRGGSSGSVGFASRTCTSSSPRSPPEIGGARHLWRVPGGLVSQPGLPSPRGFQLKAPKAQGAYPLENKGPRGEREASPRARLPLAGPTSESGARAGLTPGGMGGGGRIAEPAAPAFLADRRSPVFKPELPCCIRGECQ